MTIANSETVKPICWESLQAADVAPTVVEIFPALLTTVPVMDDGQAFQRIAVINHVAASGRGIAGKPGLRFILRMDCDRGIRAG